MLFNLWLNLENTIVSAQYFNAYFLVAREYCNNYND